MQPCTILITGATGYIGGRLVPCLLDEGHTVRCFVRDPRRLATRSWSDQVEVMQSDVLKPETLPDALEGVDVAYYLIHSLSAGEDEFAERDRQAADNFAQAAAEAGVQRIIYLGGIEPKSENLSKHMASRLETGKHLRAGSVPVTEFRAAVIVGSGSLSFELIRYLTERLPVLITPQWVRTPTQPIAIRNVLQYLTQALRVPESTGQIIEIGGEDVLTYEDMFRIYAQVRGLNRILIDVPVLTPRLSSHWVGLVTPINNRIARPLIEGLDNEVTVHDDTAQQLFDIDLLSYEASVRLALHRFTNDDVETTWSSAFSSSISDVEMVTELEEEEGMIQERLQIKVQATPSSVFTMLKRIGGDTGWLYANPLWRIRGLIDMFFGGIGLRRTRRSYSNVRVGDAIDFWRVEAIEPDRLLRLRAEMRVPGKAWLQYELAPVEDEPDHTVITQTAFYEPKGLIGFLYWWLFYIPHRFIFPGMLRELGRRAEAHEVALSAETISS
ncbi:MAG TPA: SDR family oxidoreductase [Rhodothermales bacterium]|nr:SDR family oxidoreductase [Rhodothermales bacterium]